MMSQLQSRKNIVPGICLKWKGCARVCVSLITLVRPMFVLLALHVAAIGVSPRDLAPNALAHAEAPIETRARPSCEFVVADYGHSSEVVDLARRHALPHSCQVFAYPKK